MNESLYSVFEQFQFSCATNTFATSTLMALFVINTHVAEVDLA